MNTTEIIQNILAGGLLGIMGQGIRIAVGLKKLNDANTLNVAQNAPVEEMSTSRILTSIFIGFVAGALALIVKGSGGPDVSKGFESESIVATIAIGYSGADFIEGFFSTYINKTTPSSATTAVNAAAASNTPANGEADFEDEFKG